MIRLLNIVLPLVSLFLFFLKFIKDSNRPALNSVYLQSPKIGWIIQDVSCDFKCAVPTCVSSCVFFLCLDDSWAHNQLDTVFDWVCENTWLNLMTSCSSHVILVPYSTLCTLKCLSTVHVNLMMDSDLCLTPWLVDRHSQLAGQRGRMSMNWIIWPTSGLYMSFQYLTRSLQLFKCRMTFYTIELSLDNRLLDLFFYLSNM